LLAVAGAGTAAPGAAATSNVATTVITDSAIGAAETSVVAAMDFAMKNNTIHAAIATTDAGVQ
jgi:hypothetical protein